MRGTGDDTVWHTPGLRFGLAVLIFGLACEASSVSDHADGAPADAGSVRDSSVEAVSSNGSACELASQCALVGAQCGCGSCIPSIDDYTAVARESVLEAALDCEVDMVACGACPPDDGAVGAIVIADCVHGECVVADARRSDQTRCIDGVACQPRAWSCCPSADTAHGWVAAPRGQDLELPHRCDAIEWQSDACHSTGEHLEAFCGQAGYCQLRLAGNGDDAGSDDGGSGA
jgi:hypothetical protein